MEYTILTQWHTIDGMYHSTTADYHDYDAAVGNYHAKFKPLQNDENVRDFRLMLIDANGSRPEMCYWSRPASAETDESN